MGLAGGRVSLEQGGLGGLPRPLVASLRLPYTCGTRGLGSLLKGPTPLLRARSCPLIGAEDGQQPPPTGTGCTGPRLARWPWQQGWPRALWGPELLGVESEVPEVCIAFLDS